MIYILTSAGKGVHAKGLLLGDVRPENMFISEKGEIRVGNLASFLEEDTNYRKTITFKEKTFLAPEQLENIRKGKD